MKLKIAILVLISLRGTIAIGQYSDPTYESYVRFLLSDNVDTVVRFSLLIPRHPQAMNIHGLGNVVCISIDYLFYRKGQKLYSRKLVGYYLDSIKDFTHISSKPIDISDDSIIQFVSKYSQELNREDIYPFTMTISDTAQDQVFYKHLFNFNPISFRISIYSKADSWNREVNLDDIQKSSREGPNEVQNLNFSYNISTHIYRLFKLLKAQTEKIDARYTY